MAVWKRIQEFLFAAPTEDVSARVGRGPSRGSPELTPDQARGEKSVAQGRWGELVAAEFLEARGWRIEGRNVRPVASDRRCEIDLIALSPDGGRIAFVEVKTHARRSEFAPRLAGVDRRKKRNLLRACSCWLMKRRWHGGFRFDVIEVYGVHDSGVAPEIDHVENVPLFPAKWRFYS